MIKDKKDFFPNQSSKIKKKTIYHGPASKFTKTNDKGVEYGD